MNEIIKLIQIWTARGGIWLEAANELIAAVGLQRPKQESRNVLLEQVITDNVLREQVIADVLAQGRFTRQQIEDYLDSLEKESE